jgi:hypothetical protein
MACRQILAVWPGRADATYSGSRRRRASAVGTPLWPSKLTTWRQQSLQPAHDEGAYDRAEALARRAIELNPRLANAYVNLAAAHTERHQHLAKKLAYSTRTPATELSAIYLRQRFAQMEPPLAGGFNRASPRLSILPWQSSHDRSYLPRRAAVEKLKTAHHRSICPIGDAGAINGPPRCCGCTSPHTLESWSIEAPVRARSNR